jgi:hypothetical protein
MASIDDWYSDERREQTVRAATRNAPAWVIAGVNRQRKAEGRAVLPMPERRSEAKRAQHVVLVGACAPGMSAPVLCANDGLRLVEMMAPSAYEHSLRMVRARAVNVDLREGHDGEAIVDTKSGGLEFLSGSGTGLMLVARVPLKRANATMLANALAGTMRLSIGFVPRRTEIIKHNGRKVRSFREVELHHVAVLWNNETHGVPCFREAKVWAAFDHDERGVKAAMKAAGVMASTAELKKGWH